MPHRQQLPQEPPPTTDSLPPYVEGGFINDRSGQATEAERKRLRKAPHDPIEEGIRRINRLMEQGGFGALRVSDTERILTQVEPPRAMPGIRQLAQGEPFPTSAITDAILSGREGALTYPRAIDVDPLSATRNRVGVERELIERELRRRGFGTNEVGMVNPLSALV